MSARRSPPVCDAYLESPTRPSIFHLRLRPFALTALVLLGTLAGAWLLFPGRTAAIAATPAPRAPALTVTTAMPRLVEWPNTLAASGSIAPWQEAIVGTQLGGYQLVEVRVNVGDQVRRGQVLARIDSELLRAEEAQLAASDEQARSNRERALSLRDTGAISDQEVQQLVTDAKVVAAQLASKRLQLRYTDVIAPDDGVISARIATLGAVFPAGAELFRVIRGGRLEWRGELTAAQLSSVAKGQLVDLALPDGSSASAKVRDAAPTLDSRSRLGLVYADLVPGSRARAGMYANGQVVVSRKRALVVPAESVVIRDGRSYVVTLVDETATPAVALHPVAAGRRRDNEIEIVSGLAASEVVVRAGAAFLSDGDIVRLAGDGLRPLAAVIDAGPAR